MNKSSKDILKEFGKVALVIMATLFILGIWANWDSEPEVSVAPIATPAYNNSYMQDIRSAYMGGCTEGYGNDKFVNEYCTCSFDYIKLDLGDSLLIKEFVKFGETDIMPTNLEESMNDAVEYCL